ncbi:MAG: radical SAM protein [Chloroflexi bacterium]|nr:radical SAM protein [Chloroflexota bacterium]
MVITGTWQGRPLTISVKRNCLTVSTDDPSQADVFSYDLEGRMWTAFIDGIAYRRGLDGKMVARWRNPGEERNRRWLPQDEAVSIEARAHRHIQHLYTAIQQGEAELRTPLSPQGHQVFRQILAFDPAHSMADAARYYDVYKPVGILPPDQYMAVVLQMTEGCSFNTCNFCTFYKDRPFRIKSPDEFRQHAIAVRDFLGAGLSLRRTIFLGDANAMVVPMRTLLPLLDVVHEVYDVDKLGGMYAFLDGFSGEKKPAADYQRLYDKGIKTVYIGLESGHAPLLKFLKKPGTPREAIKAVRAIKAGGIAVGIIILLGAGGQQHADSHVRDTIKALNAMDLDMDDIIYFSEILVGEDTPYAREAYQAGLQPLSHSERLAQGAAIEAGLHFSSEGGVPKISRYDIREFVY